jgi:hypothetical protein
MRNLAAILLACSVLSQTALAQTPAAPAVQTSSSVAPAGRDSATPVDEAELRTWIKEYEAWQAWADEWLSRPQAVWHPFPYPFWKTMPDAFSYVAARRLEPPPPVWLEQACQDWGGEVAGRDPHAEGCRLLAESHEDLATQRIRWAIQRARLQKDAPQRTRFSEHIHFASLGTSLQASGPRAYSLAGVHATIDVHGRWQVYAFPGVMAVNVPNRDGQRIVTIGYDWGFAIRLFDLQVPILDVPARAHINLVQVWVPEVQQRMDMVGLSFSLHRQK